MELALGITGAITGVIGLVISVFGVINKRFLALSDFYSLDRDLTSIKARKKAYDLQKDEISYDPEISYVISYFHFWGLMVKKGFLPFYIFKSASGLAVVKLYSKLKPTIADHRKANEYYAEYFEWLYIKIRRKMNINTIED